MLTKMSSRERMLSAIRRQRHQDILVLRVREFECVYIFLR
jgi:hypothetical protein